jgi:para-nitrobenzyl esterase
LLDTVAAEHPIAATAVGAAVNVAEELSDSADDPAPDREEPDSQQAG